MVKWLSVYNLNITYLRADLEVCLRSCLLLDVS